MKADVVVFRNQNGRACVRPSAFIVELLGNQNQFRIRNDTDKTVYIVIPHDQGMITEILNVKGAGRGPHKKIIDVSNKTQNGSGVIYYHVYLGVEEAQGESAPALIIDD